MDDSTRGLGATHSIVKAGEGTMPPPVGRHRLSTSAQATIAMPTLGAMDRGPMAMSPPVLIHPESHSPTVASW